MSMGSKSVIFEGEVYWDCQSGKTPLLRIDLKSTAARTSSSERIRHSSSSGYSGSDSEDQSDWKSLAFEELGETPEVRQTSLAQVRSWITAQSHLQGCCSEGSLLRLDMPSIDADNFLLRFLRVNKFDIAKACKMLEKYLEMRCDHPHWFMDLNPVGNKNVEELVNTGYVFVLPQCDADGRRVIFNLANKVDPSRHTSADIMKTFIATFETLLADPENQVRGFTYVFYCKGLTLSHCSVWTPSDAATMFISCEKNLPIRHRSINLMNLPFGMWAVFEFAKSFLSQKIRTRIVTLSDDKKLCKRLGRDILPKEFGGKIPMAQMTALWWKDLVKNKSRLEALDSLIVGRESGTPCVFSTPVKSTPGKPRDRKAFWY